MKNKCGVNGRSSNFFYAFVDYENTEAYHTDVEGQIVDLGLKFGLIDRKGAWYSYKDIRVSGMENFVAKLIEEKALIKLESEVTEIISKTK